MDAVLYAIIQGVTLILLNQQSRIGYSYPTMLVKTPEGRYWNIDCYLGNMRRESIKAFKSWLPLDLVEEDEAIKVLTKDFGMNREAVDGMFKEFANEEPFPTEDEVEWFKRMHSRLNIEYSNYEFCSYTYEDMSRIIDSVLKANS